MPAINLVLLSLTLSVNQIEGEVQSEQSELDRAVDVSINKCCPEGQHLDTSNIKRPFCRENGRETSPAKVIKGMNQRSNRPVNINLTQKIQKSSSIPPCLTEFEVLRIENSGELTTSIEQYFDFHH